MKKLSFCIALFVSIQLTPAQTNPSSIEVESVKKHLYTLASDAMEGRRAGTPGIERAAQYIESEFERIGLSKYNNLPTYRQNFTARNLKMFNVIGVLEGKSKKDEYVVISAHYDHLGVKKEGEGDMIYNGADDDASGTTAVSCISRILYCLRNKRAYLNFCSILQARKWGY